MKLNKPLIAGVSPMSCNDFPGEISYVIFLAGCNFRCPYCHNASVVKNEALSLDPNTVLEEIKKRKGFINAVVITGGEATLHGQKLLNLLREIKEMGFKTKLDTNGTNPDLLKKCIDNSLVDYVAMDIKNTFEKYNETAGTDVDIEKIKQSIDLIEKSKIDYEFRTTVSKGFHTESDIKKIKTYLKKPEKYFLQNYKYNENQLINKNFIPFEEEELIKLQASSKINVKI